MRGWSRHTRHRIAVRGGEKRSGLKGPMLCCSTAVFAILDAAARPSATLQRQHTLFWLSSLGAHAALLALRFGRIQYGTVAALIMV